MSTVLLQLSQEEVQVRTFYLSLSHARNYAADKPLGKMLTTSYKY